MKRPLVLHVYRTANQQWAWRVRAGNGKIIADSGEAYVRLADCVNGAALVTGLDLNGLNAGDTWTIKGVNARAWRSRDWRVEVES